MGNPATVALVASAVIGAGAAIQSGRNQKAAAQFQEAEAERQGTQTRIQAQDDELQRRRELAGTLGEQAALGAQSGFDPFGAGSSFLALREETEREAARDVSAIRLLGANRMETSRLNSAGFRTAGSAAQTQGYLRAAGTLTQAGGQLRATRNTTATGGGGFSGTALHSGGTR